MESIAYLYKEFNDLVFVKSTFENDTYTVYLRFNKRVKAVCCECGNPFGKKAHSKYTRTLQDISTHSAQKAFAYKVIVKIDTHKYRCAECGQIRTPAISIARKGSRFTNRLISMAIDHLDAQTTIKKVASFTGISESTINRMEIEHIQASLPPPQEAKPRTIAVDEIAIRKGRKYATVVYDWDSGRILWMIKGHDSEALEKYIHTLTNAQKAGIAIVSMDMWRPYHHAVEKLLPHAEIIADPFHVSKAIYKSVEEQRKIEFKQIKTEERLSKQQIGMFKKNPDNLKPDQYDSLTEDLKKNESLYKLYLLKERVHRLWKIKTLDQAKTTLYQIVLDFIHSPFEKLQSVCKTIMGYYDKILNGFKHQVNNGKAEGINNKIKVFKRKGYGYPNFEKFKARVMFYV